MMIELGSLCSSCAVSVVFTAMLTSKSRVIRLKFDQASEITALQGQKLILSSKPFSFKKLKFGFDYFRIVLTIETAQHISETFRGQRHALLL